MENFYRVRLIHKKLSGIFMKSVVETEIYFTLKDEAKNWLMEKGFVYGQSLHFKKTERGYWFHQKDIPSDFVEVEIDEVCLHDQETACQEDWVDELNLNYSRSNKTVSAFEASSVCVRNI